MYYLFAILKWYKLGLRKDFLVHKRKTIESFKLVRDDISTLDGSINNLKNTLVSVESRISNIYNETLNLRDAIGQNASEINAQRSHNANMQSKIEQINKSISNAIFTIESLNKGVSNLISKQQQLSGNVSGNSNAIKKLFSITKVQSLRNRQLNSALNKSQIEFKKIRSFLNIKLRGVNRANKGVEATIKNQRKRIVALNRKIEGKKSIRIKAKRKAKKRASSATRKTTKKIITPKKTIVEVVQKEVRK